MKMILALVLSVFGVFSNAQESIDQNAHSELPASVGQQEKKVQRKFAGYIATRAGYGDSAGSANDRAESSTSAISVLGSLVISNRRLVFDAGFGLQHHYFVHSNAIKKLTSTPVLEGSMRFQFKNRWQWGVIANQVFDSGRYFYANQADVLFAGSQLLREFSIGDMYIGRVGARFMNALNVENETFNTIQIEFQVGWDGFTRQ